MTRYGWLIRGEMASVFAPAGANALVLASLFVSLVAPLTGAHAQDAFDISKVPAEGRAVLAEIVDLDGDGRSDLLRGEFRGIPPQETRRLFVHKKDIDGNIPPLPTFEVAVPPDTAAYDLADVHEAPGVEILFLRAGGVTALNLATADGARREYDLESGVSIGAAADERGLDRFRIAWNEFADEPWVVVPLLGEVAAFAASGDPVARMEVGGRANYLVVPRPGPIVAESDIQLFFDAPRFSAGDVDGDGRTDFIAASRHEIRVFLRNETGGFPAKPTRKLFPALINERDHIRGSGAVRVDARDLNADGRVDLIVSHLSGGIADAKGHTSVHINRHGAWALDAPDVTFERGSGWGVDDIVDLDGDGRPELVRIGIPFSVLEVAEALIQRALDIQISVHRSDPETGFAKAEWWDKKLDLPLSFESGRPLGFVPTARADLNGDGMGDLLTAGGGKRLTVYLGTPQGGFDDRHGRQSLDTEGRIGFGDLDDDGLIDWVIYDPRRSGVPVRLGHNRGVLPGTIRPSSPSVGAQAKPPIPTLSPRERD